MAEKPAGSAPSETDDELIGTVVAGRYRLLEKLGEGGMGAVYRGVHEALRKPVAVKLLGRAARGNRELMTRFQREAVAAANLKHPNIAEATDSGQIPDGRLFMVIEYVEGRTLRSILKEGRLPPARAMGVLRQIGAAVSFAHGREVVHRDLKPENVVVFDRGDEKDLVKVIDFGIARMRSSFAGGRSGLTQEGSVVGTVEYMAPEQAMGQEVDARADQYALGVIAFELLTGQPPYVSDEVTSLIYMHVGAPIPRPSERVPELGGGVDEVLAKMMGKLPDERFASVSEALAALAKAIENPSPVVAQAAPAGVPGQTARGTIITSTGTIPMPAVPTGFAVVAPPAAPAAAPAITTAAAPASLRTPPAAPGGAAADGGRKPPLLLIGISSAVGLLIIVIVVVVVLSGSSSSQPSDATRPLPTTELPPISTEGSFPTSPGPPEGAGLGQGKGKGKGKGKGPR